MHSVYILFSETLDRYYIGRTDGPVELRLQKHLTNHKGFTAKAKDWQIVHVEAYATKDESCKRETALKRLKSRPQIEALILQNRAKS